MLQMSLFDGEKHQAIKRLFEDFPMSENLSDAQVVRRSLPGMERVRTCNISRSDIKLVRAVKKDTEWLKYVSATYNLAADRLREAHKNGDPRMHRCPLCGWCTGWEEMKWIHECEYRGGSGNTYYNGFKDAEAIAMGEEGE